jgi:hypothetical protein
VISRDAVVSVWCQQDGARAVLPVDHKIIANSTSVRALIVDLARSAEPEDELYDACAVLGRLIGQEGGSPTLASATMDSACGALGVDGPTWLAPARSAVVEGFAQALIDATRSESALAWEFPGCSVPLGDGAIAIAAGYPSDDVEALDAWAARVAKSAALTGVRRVIVAGPEDPRRTLTEALGVIGIEVVLGLSVGSAARYEGSRT